MSAKSPYFYPLFWPLDEVELGVEDGGDVFDVSRYKRLGDLVLFLQEKIFWIVA